MDKKSAQPVVLILGGLVILVGLGWLVSHAGDIIRMIISVLIICFPFIGGGIIYLVINGWVNKIANKDK